MGIMLRALSELMEKGYTSKENRKMLMKFAGFIDNGTYVCIDCTGCKYRTNLGCDNPKDCRRDVLPDLYEKGVNADGESNDS